MIPRVLDRVPECFPRYFEAWTIASSLAIAPVEQRNLHDSRERLHSYSITNQFSNSG